VNAFEIHAMHVILKLDKVGVLGGAFVNITAQKHALFLIIRTEQFRNICMLIQTSCRHTIFIYSTKIFSLVFITLAFKIWLF
jgi:hypothetical protein